MLLLPFLKNTKMLKSLKLARTLRLFRVVNRVVNAAVDAMNVDIVQACENGNVSMLKTALLTGQNIHQRDYFGNTPLHTVASAGHLQMVKLLVRDKRMKPGDIDARDNDGRTPLYVAAHFKHEEVVHFLLLNVENLDASLKTSVWAGAQLGLTVESVLRRRGLFRMVDDIRAERIARRNEELAEIAAREAEAAKIKNLRTLVRNPKNIKYI